MAASSSAPAPEVESQPNHKLNLSMTKMLAQSFLAAVREDYDVLESAERDGDRIIRTVIQVVRV